MADADFNIFGLRPILQNATFKITSLAAHQDHIYVGSKDGRVTVYQSEVESTELASQRVSRKAIEQLGVYHAASELVCVSAGKVYVLEAGKYGASTGIFMPSLDKCSESTATVQKRAKHAQAFCFDESPTASNRLCVAAKRRLVIFEYAQGGWHFWKELALPEQPVALRWCGPSICVAYKREYNIIHPETGSTVNIPLTLDGGAVPLIKALPGEQFLLGGAQGVGVLITLNAEPTAGVVGWSGAASAASYSFPYLTSLVTQDSTGGSGSGSVVIEVHSMLDQQKRLQTIQVPRDVNVLVDGALGSEAGVGSSAQETKSSNGTGAGGVAVTARRRIFFSSISAIYELTMVDYEHQIMELVQQLEVNAARLLLEHTVEPAQREARTAQFYREAGLILFANLEFEDAIEYIGKSDVDMRELIQLFPSLLPLAGISGDFRPQLLRPKSQGGLLPSNSTDIRSLIRSLRNRRNRMRAEEGKRGLGSEDEELASARLCLLKIIEERRAAMLSESSFDNITERDQLRCIDTAIFNIYAGDATMHDKLSAFVEDDNEVHLEDADDMLQRVELFHVLALLNANKKRVREALEIWMRIGTGEYTDRAGHRGVEETVSFLCNVQGASPELIWTFSSWVLRVDPAAGVRIFTESRREQELPPDRVLEFLHSFDEAAGESSWPRKARISYLEHLVEGTGASEERYHTQLATEYVYLTLDVLDRGDGTATHGRFPPVRRSLLNFLRSSSIYNVATMLGVTAHKGLHEERVLLLGKSGAHVEALHILVHDLHDLKEAESYCAEHSPATEEDPTHSRSLFLPLINLYLERGDQQTSMMLLQRHAAHIDTVQVLKQLSDTTSLQTLQPYLQNALRHGVRRQRAGQIAKNLAKMENLNTRRRLAQLETRAVIISHSTSCCVCGQQILPNTVFVVFPAGEVAHLKCCPHGLDVHPLPPHASLASQDRAKLRWSLIPG